MVRARVRVRVRVRALLHAQEGLLVLHLGRVVHVAIQDDVVRRVAQLRHDLAAGLLVQG